MVTVTLPAGSVSRTTVYVSKSPSSKSREVSEIVTPTVSSSVTLTATLPAVRPSYLVSAVEETVWVMLTTSSSTASSSCPAVTRTVCAVSQLPVVKVSVALSRVRSVPADAADGHRHVARGLGVQDHRVGVEVPSSSMSREVSEIVTPTVSSSAMVTIVWAVPPSLTPAGRVLPKFNFTDSPSSSTSSWVAANVKLVDVAPALMVISGARWSSRRRTRHPARSP